MLRIEIYAMAPKIKSITEAIDLIKVRTTVLIQVTIAYFSREKRIKINESKINFVY